MSMQIISAQHGAMIKKTMMDLTRDLTHWWYPSSSGNANDLIGTLHGTMLGGLVAGVNGFDMGTDNGKYVELSGPVDNGTSYSLSVWVKPDKTAMDLNTYGGWIFSDRGNTSTPNDRDFQLTYLNHNYPPAGYRGQVFSPSSSVHSGGITCLHNTWQHLIMTVDSDYVSMYLDGQFVGQTATGFAPENSSTVNATIGTGSWAPGSFDIKWHGAIDNLRFYKDRVLTDGECQSLFNLGR